MPHDEPRNRPAHPPPPAQGHIRTPMLAREPSRFETLGRSVRSVISAASRRASGSQPQPRQRTRPVSFGGAITGFSPAAPTPTTTTSHDYLTVFNDDDEPADDAGMLAVHDDGDDILWAAWDAVGSTRVLLLAYASGIQVWDVSDLASIREMLNLDAMSLSLGSVLAAAVLPGFKDEEGPVLGILTHNELMAYSLHTHRTVHRVPAPHAASMAASAQYVVISTTQPPALHVYSTATLEPIHVVPADQLSSPTPVFALSGRLLAFTSTPPPAHVRAGRGDPPSPLSLGSTGSSPAANIASMAWRVGEGVWSGIRALAAPAPVPMPAHHERGTSERGFTSKSAPASSAVYETLRARWESVASPGSPPSPTASTVRRRTSDVLSTASDGAGGFVTVFDLARLDTLAQFEAAHQSVVGLSFNTAGTVLSVAPADGGVVRLFSVARQPVHLYELRRGFSAASIRGVTWAGDMRWVGVVTGRGTVHVFPTNPYGGKSDERSHIEGAVRNARQQASSPTELRPLVRLRPPAPPAIHHQQPGQHTSHRVAVSATFLPAHSELPHMLRPAKGRAVQDVLVFERGQGTLSLCRIEMGLGGEGSESVVATWRLGRGREWGEVREAFAPSEPSPPAVPTGNWLAHAELSTCAITLASSIYRAHQFGFCALRDDFHALIRRAQLELPCARLEVRRAPPLGRRRYEEEEEGFGDGRWAVDEAMRERLEFDAEPVLPMLPNGGVRSGGGAQSVGAVVGRIRREVRKMRSPRLAPARTSDEDLSASASASLSTPSTRAAELGEDDGWEPQDARAVEEAEMFDEICPAGIMDEELESIRRKLCNLKTRSTD